MTANIQSDRKYSERRAGQTKGQNQNNRPECHRESTGLKFDSLYLYLNAIINYTNISI